MMLETTEIRWFWPRPDEDDVLHWFAGSAVDWGHDADIRTDRYLWLPGCRATGVKVREGRFEIKALVKDVGYCVFSEGLAGQVQRWLKWSTDSPALVGLDKISSEDRWIEMTKERLMRRFIFDGGAFVEGPHDQEAPASDGHVELTRLSLPDRSQPWLTLGFEVSAAAEDQVDLLYDLVQHFFRQQPPCPNALLQAGSRSYPDWLSSLES